MKKVNQTMRAVVTTRHGGLDVLDYRCDVPVPYPLSGEVLIRVSACGLNNADINTRVGWYSKVVTEATSGGGYETVDEDDATWAAAPISFPRIQGSDVCGEIIAVGAGVSTTRIGERVITDNWLRDPSNKNRPGYFGSERDGGFAEYTVIPAQNAIAIRSDLSDAELATFSCSYSTAESMLTRANVFSGDTVLVSGSSGGVGGAVVQLAKRRGARVIAMASETKHEEVAKLCPDRILSRAPEDLRATLRHERVTVVADVVGGPYWSKLIDILEHGGRYTCSGAIAGPIVELDLRTFYLRDLTFIGSTVIDPRVMSNIVGYIEAGEVAPILAATYPLEKLREAQAAFIAKKHVGNIVVVP